MTILLDIGGGRFAARGYINVDPAPGIPGAVQAPMWALPWDDASVDGIRCYHALEHVHKSRVVPALNEWARVLRDDAPLDLMVPDLAWVLTNWLAVRGNGYAMDTIFGGQHYPGDEHRTGFDEALLRMYFAQVPAFTVERITTEDSHDQQSIRVQARRLPR